MTDNMSPWDWIKYHGAIQETLFSAKAAGTVLCTADPMRQWLAFASAASGAALFVSPGLKAVGSQGFVLTSTQTLLIFRAKDDPILTQSGWIIGGVAPSNTLTVYTLSAIDWPRDNTNGDESSVYRGARTSNRPGAYSNPASSGFGAALRKLWNALPGLRPDPF